MKTGGSNGVNRPEMVFLRRESRARNEGQVSKNSVSPTETVTIGQPGSQREVTPLLSMTGETLVSQASQIGLRAVASLALSGPLAAVFSPLEAAMLNPSSYHGVAHPNNAIETGIT